MSVIPKINTKPTGARRWLRKGESFNRKLLGSTAVGALSICALSVAFIYYAVRDHNLDTLRIQTLDLVRVANQIEKNLASLEMSHRGYLLTGNPISMNRFDTAREELDQQIPQLTKIVNAEDRSSIPKISSSISRWLGEVGIPQMKGKRTASVALAEVEASSVGRSLIDSPRIELVRLQKSAEARLQYHAGNSVAAGNSYQILTFAPRLESSLAEMNKAVWGFLLTGSPACREAYRKSNDDFTSVMGFVSVLVSEDGPQKKLLDEAGAAVDLWQKNFAAPAFKVGEGGSNASEIATKANPELLDKAFKTLDAFEAIEAQRFETNNFTERMTRIGKAVALGGVALLAIGVMLASSFYNFTAYRRHVHGIETAEAQTRSIIETTLDGVITINDQGTVLSMNPAAEEMFVQPSGSVIGKSVSILIPQRLFIHDIANVGRGTLMAVGQRQNYYPFPIEISLNEMSSGNRKTYVAIIRDVTERKRSEETLRNIGLGVTASTGEEFIRSLVKQLSKALQTDFAFIVQLTRKGAQMTSALTLAEHGQIRNRPDYPLAETAFEDVLKRGFRAFTQKVCKEFPQDPLLAELNAESFLATTLTDHKGTVVGLMGVIDRKETDDLSIAESTLRIFAARAGAELERKRFEEDLAAEKERLAVTLRSIADGCVTIDVEGHVVLLNSVAEKLTGWTQAQAQGHALTDILHLQNPRTRQPLNEAIQRLIETGSPVGLDGTAVLVSSKGTECAVESNASPIRDRNNRRIGVVVVIRDVTERVRIEEERRKAEKLESLGVAAGGIAHDFNNLLTSIIGNLSLALISLPPEDSIAARLATAKKSSLRAQELSQQLLTFAKGGAPIKKAASITQIISDTVSFTLRGTNVRSAFEFEENLWPAELDSSQFSQVIGNLVMNAAQAMPAGGAVTVSCANAFLEKEEAERYAVREGRYLRIDVKDEGVGIPEAHLENIFDPYFSTKNGASGLGLATAYSIIKQHEGHIGAESTAGNGSQLTIHIPAAIETVKRTEVARTPKKGAGRILILDDEEDICALVTYALTPLGFSVTETYDATTAINAYKDAMERGEKFDAVISDLTIPGSMGGQEAVRKLIEMDPDVKAIVSSGYARDPVMANYRDYGFCACIAKPYEISAMCELVSDVVFSGTGQKIAKEAPEPASVA